MLKKLGCPFGCSSDGQTDEMKTFELSDVDSTKKIKRYTDSQCISFIEQRPKEFS